MRAGVRVCLKYFFMALSCALMVVGTARAAPTCSDQLTPVSILPDGPKTYEIYGRLCHPASGPSLAIQILVHGFTYDHTYWSAPGYGDAYDYVKRATDAGYTTLAIDRLGTAGQSSRPPSALMSLAAHASSLHDVVTAAKTGQLSGGPYEKIIIVGHSAGSAVAWLEASLFHDVDGIVSSGFGHPLGSGHNVILNTMLAIFDNNFQPLVGLDLGYVTTAPGSRDDLFYRTQTADPAVIAYDEATKNMAALLEFGTLPAAEVTTAAITAPMLFVMGEYDNIFCIQAALGGLDNCASDSTLYASEKLYFPLVSDFEAYVQVGAGHNNNLHLNAQDWFDRVIDWAVQRFPPAP